LVFGLYAVSASKRSVYLLALYPAFFLLLGQCLAAPSGAFRRPCRFLDPLAWAVAWLCGCLSVALALAHAGLPLDAIPATLLTDDAAEQAGDVAAVLAKHGGTLAALFSGCTAAAAVAALAASHRCRGLTFAGLFFLAVLLNVALRQVVLPDLARTDSRAALIAAARRAAAPPEKLFSFGHLDYRLVHAAGGRLPVVEDGTLKQGPRYLLMPEKKWNLTGGSLGHPYEYVWLPRSTHKRSRWVLVQRRTAEADPS